MQPGVKTSEFDAWKERMLSFEEGKEERPAKKKGVFILQRGIGAPWAHEWDCKR